MDKNKEIFFQDNVHVSVNGRNLDITEKGSFTIRQALYDYPVKSGKTGILSINSINIQNSGNVKQSDVVKCRTLLPVKKSFYSNNHVIKDQAFVDDEIELHELLNHANIDQPYVDASQYYSSQGINGLYVEGYTKNTEDAYSSLDMLNQTEADPQSDSFAWLNMAVILTGVGLGIGGLGYWYYKKQIDKDDKASDQPTGSSTEATNEQTNKTGKLEALNESSSAANMDKVNAGVDDNSDQPGIGDDTVATDNHVVIAGKVTLGPVIENNGLSVQILSLDNVLLTEAVVDENGAYSTTIEKRSGIIKAKVIDKDDLPDYRDEATGAVKDSDTPLLSIIAIQEDIPEVVMHINPVTTLISRLLAVDSESSQQLSAESIKTVNDQVAMAFFNELVDIVSYDIKPLINQAGETVEGNAGGTVLAMISSLEDKNNQTTGEVIQQLADGFVSVEGKQVMSNESAQLLQEATVHLSNTMGGDAGASARQQIGKIVEVNKVSVNLSPITDESQITFDEDSVYDFKVSDFIFFDGNKEDSLQSIMVVRVPLTGVLKLGDEVVADNTTIAVADIAQLNFTPVLNENGDQYGDFIFKVFDGNSFSNEATLTIGVNAVNDTAVISGVTNASLTEDSTTSASGVLAVTDVDEGEANFETVTDVKGSYGQLSVTAEGQWSYTVDNDLAAIQSLTNNQNLIDTLEISTLDGTKQSIDITITGINDAPQTEQVDLGTIDEDTTLIVTPSQLLEKATDAESESLALSDVALIDNAQGVLTVLNDQWQFIPALNKHGNDIGLSYKISDGTTTIDANAIFHIRAVNDLPVVSPDSEQIPTLTSADDGSGFVVTGSSSEGADYSPYKAFDNTQADDQDIGAWSVAGQAGWLQVDMGHVTPIVKYSIVNVVDYDRSPRDWELKGSLDGVNFTLIDSQADVDDWVAREAKSYMLNESQSYRYYRMDISNNNGDNYTSIDQLQLYSSIDLGSTQEDTALTITAAQLKANATDVDITDTLTVVDIELADSSKGALSDNGNETWTFTPAENVHGNNVRINFNVNDGTVSVPSFALVDIVSVNDKPEAPAITLSALEDGPIVAQQASVVDGDSADTHTISILTQPDKGSASFSSLPEPLRHYSLRENAQDSSGHNQHGIISSNGDTQGVTFVEDPGRGWVADFDDSGLITIASQADEGIEAAEGLPVKDMTAAAWVKVDSEKSYGGFFGIIQDTGSDAGNKDNESGWLLGAEGKQFNFALVTDGKEITYLTDPDSFILGAWNHVAATYDGSITKLYVNGVKVAEDSSQSGDVLYPDMSSAIFQIGSYKDDNEDLRHDGQLSDVRLYDRALGLSDILDVMGGKHTGINFDSGEAFQDLDGSETETVTFTYEATDNSGTGNAASEPATVTVTVAGVNDAPTLSLGDEHSVHTTMAGKQFQSSLAMLPDGGYIVVWGAGEKGDGSQTFQGQKYTAEHLPLGDEIKLNTHSPNYDDFLRGLSVAAIDNGNVAVLWEHFNPGVRPGTRIQVFDENHGQLLAEKTFGGAYYSNQILQLDEGRFLTAGLPSGSMKSTLYILNDEGVTQNTIVTPYIGGWGWGKQQLALTHNEAGETSGFVLTYRLAGSSNDNLRIHNYDIDGGSETSAAFGGAYTSAMKHAVVDGLAKGGVITAYQSADDFFIQKFNNDSTLSGNRIEVLAGHSAEDLQVVALNDGSFFLLWSEAVDKNGNVDNDIFGQRFNTDGSTLSDIVPINTTTIGDQTQVQAILLDDGNIQVSWTSEVNGDFDVHTRTLVLYKVSDTAAESSVVGKVAPLHDIDIDTLTYTLEDDAGGRFKINDQGEIQVASPDLIDAATATQHVITVKVTDAGGLADTHDYTVYVVAGDSDPVGGPGHRIEVEQGSDVLAFLSSQLVEGMPSYTLDVNQDNLINNEDQVTLAELSNLLGQAGQIGQDGHVLRLPTDDELADASLFQPFTEPGLDGAVSLWAHQSDQSIQTPYHIVGELSPVLEEDAALAMFQLIA